MDITGREERAIKDNRAISRRKFLELMGLTASAAALGACTSPTPVVVTATPSPVPPTPTPVSEPGGFEMGSAAGAPNEQPVHTVNLTRSFYMAKYEANVNLYAAFCQDTARAMPERYGPGYDDRPIVLSWYDATELCNWLSERSGLNPCYSLALINTECDFDASGYRLPTEAEWEFAARGGIHSQGYLYAGSNYPRTVGWYDANSQGYRRPVGQKLPNELGLYDMSGNLREWCWDWYERDYYSVSPTGDPAGPELDLEHFADVNRVRRGGSFDSWEAELRSTYRTYCWPDRVGTTTGVRLVRTVSS